MEHFIQRYTEPTLVTRGEERVAMHVLEEVNEEEKRAVFIFSLCGKVVDGSYLLAHMLFPWINNTVASISYWHTNILCLYKTTATFN